MARKGFSDEAKECGAFLSQFVNCRLSPTDLSTLVTECLNIMKRYLGYSDPKWDDTGIVNISPFDELVSKTQGRFFRECVVTYFQFRCLEELYSGKERIDARIKRLRGKASLLHERDWGADNDRVRGDLFFYLEFALLRRKFRKIFRELIRGKTLEQIQHHPFFKDFVQRFKSEYLDLNQQVVIQNNKLTIVPLMTSLPNDTYSPGSFLSAYLFPCLCYCFVVLSSEENLHKIKRCTECKGFYRSKTDRVSKYCSDRCRLSYHNRIRIESGEHAEYKRMRKEQGKATASYYG